MPPALRNVAASPSPPPWWPLDSTRLQDGTSKPPSLCLLSPKFFTEKRPVLVKKTMVSRALDFETAPELLQIQSLWDMSISVFTFCGEGGNLTSIQAFWWNLSGWILAFWKSYQLQNLQGGPRIQLQIGWNINIPKKRNNYPFIRPLIGLITPLIICRPPLQYDAGSRKPCPQTRSSTKSDILHSRKLTRHNPLTGKWSSQASWKRLLLLQPGPSPKPNNEATGPIYYPNRTYVSRYEYIYIYIYIYYILHRSKCSYHILSICCTLYTYKHIIKSHGISLGTPKSKVHTSKKKAFKKASRCFLGTIISTNSNPTNFPTSVWTNRVGCEESVWNHNWPWKTTLFCPGALVQKRSWRGGA